MLKRALITAGIAISAAVGAAGVAGAAPVPAPLTVCSAVVGAPYHPAGFGSFTDKVPNYSADNPGYSVRRYIYASKLDSDSTWYEFQDRDNIYAGGFAPFPPGGSSPVGRYLDMRYRVVLNATVNPPANAGSTTPWSSTSAYPMPSASGTINNC